MNKIISIGVGIAALFLIEEQARNTFLGFRGPYVYIAAGVEDSKIIQGGTARFFFDFDHIKFCQDNLARFVATQPDNAIVYRDSVPGGAVGLGKQHVVNPFKLPPELRVGKYKFRVFANSECRDGVHSTPAPEIEFEIVE